MDQVKPPCIVLLVGNPGTGKTWVMLRLIKHFQCLKRQRYGTIYFHSSDQVVVTGKYDGSMYQGSDRLSMAVMKDYDEFIACMSGKYVILEGDRFMNTKVLQHKVQPLVIKIIGDGASGRQTRGSNQSEGHLKRMATRNNNINAHVEVSGSEEALNYIQAVINEI